MRYTDRSRTETDWTCPRARWWAYEWEGSGLSPIEPNEDLTFGLAVACLAEGIRTAQLLPPCSLGPPYAALYMGLAEAYSTHIWPEWQQQFEVLSTELECHCSLGPTVTYMARPDAVLRRKEDKTVWYLEDKTTSQNPQTFVRGWDKQVQVHATCVAIEHQLGVEVSGCYVQGWYKGYLKNNTLYSPLAYAWCKRGQPGMGKDQWSFEYRPGWERRPITDMDVTAWVKSLPDVLIQQQFPVTGPILVNRALVADYFEALTLREQAIGHYARGMAPLTLFPQHFMHCDDYGKYRRPCAFRDCCWAPTVGRDPLGSGLFVLRTPHHAAEVRLLT